MRATARWLIVAFTICAWIAISNHCAFRAVASKAEASRSACPFHSKPAKVPSKSASTECCKILRALVATSAKQLAPAIVDLANVDRDCTRVEIPRPEISFLTKSLDTGPPGTTTFLELSSSIRAHAPPLLA